GVKSNESARIRSAVNMWPIGVLRPGLAECARAKLTPDGNREGLTGLEGHKTVHVIPEHEIDLKLPRVPTLPGGLGVAPHIMLASSTMSTATATLEAASSDIAYWTAALPNFQLSVHQASLPMPLATSSPVAKI